MLDTNYNQCFKSSPMLHWAQSGRAERNLRTLFMPIPKSDGSMLECMWDQNCKNFRATYFPAFTHPARTLLDACIFLFQHPSTYGMTRWFNILLFPSAPLKKFGELQQHCSKLFFALHAISIKFGFNGVKLQM